MTLYDKIKHILKREEACVITRNSSPKYVAMTWNRYRRMQDEISQLRQLQETDATLQAEPEMQESIEMASVPPLFEAEESAIRLAGVGTVPHTSKIPETIDISEVPV
jgi:hypothetical protein